MAASYIISEKELMEMAGQCLTLSEWKPFAVKYLGLEEVECDSARFGAESFTDYKFLCMRKWRNINPRKTLQDLRDLVRDFHQARPSHPPRSRNTVKLVMKDGTEREVYIIPKHTSFCDAAPSLHPTEIMPAELANQLPDIQSIQELEGANVPVQRLVHVPEPEEPAEPIGLHDALNYPDEGASQPSENPEQQSEIVAEYTRGETTSTEGFGGESTASRPLLQSMPSRLEGLPDTLLESASQAVNEPLYRSVSCPAESVVGSQNIQRPFQPPEGPFYSQANSHEVSMPSSCESSVQDGPRHLLNRTDIWDDGSEYTGEKMHGRRHGQGVYKSAFGDVYEGEFKDDQYHGHGMLVFQSKATYNGQWFNGMRHGQGIYIYPDGKTKYSGGFRDSKFDGKGEMTYFDGTKYNGHWQSGKQHGQGKFTYPNGSDKTVHYENGKLLRTL
jgi:hypothetical protein